MTTVTIPPQYIQEWQGIERTVQNLVAQGIEGQYLQKKQEFESRQQAIQSEQHKLKQLEEKAAKEQKDVKKIDRPGLTKFKARVQGKLDEKTAKEKREADEAVAAVNAQKQRLQAMNGELQQVQQAVQYLGAQYDQLRNSQRAKEDLLNRVFDGGLGDEQENRLEAELAALKPEFMQWERRSQDDKKALEHMRQAVGWCAKSLQCMRQAEQAQQMDMITNIGRNNDLFGNMANIQKRQTLKGAEQCMQKAAEHVDRARDFVPEVQRIDPNLVKSLNFGVDLVFDNMLTDMAAGKKIKESTQRIAATFQHLQQGTQWVENRVRDNGTRFDESKRRFESKKTELMGYRAQLMTRAASGATWNAFSGDRSQFGLGVPAAAAPPPYSPYPGESPAPFDFSQISAALPEYATEAAQYSLPAPSCAKCQAPLGDAVKCCAQCGTPIQSADVQPSALPAGYPTSH